MASTDSAKKRLAEIAAQTVAMFLNESIPQIVNAINVRYSSEFGGEQVHISKDNGERNAVRNELIRRDLAAGMSTRAVAKKYHIGKSHAARLAKQVSSTST